MKKIAYALILLSSLFSFSHAEDNKSYTTEKRSNSVVYIIPVVFHVLHNYGPENISDAQILDQLEILNQDFRKLNADTANIDSAFQGVAADCEIEFRLASIDPNGNCTNGIDRVQTMLTYNANDNSKINSWPNNKYLNIWVVSSLQNSIVGATGTFPGGNDSLDGLICLSNYVGSIGTGSLATFRTITHELGHYFNLFHPWGSGTLGVTCGDDGISDTPETMGWSNCVPNGSICNPPIIENVQNFMEFSYCRIMFTEGQKTKMHVTLNSSISGRNNLWSPANLLATGITQGPQICTPVADFYIDHRLICEGSDVTYYDLSWNSNVTNRSWSFPGGTPSTSTDSAVTVNYPTAGNYSATLIVSNATGIDSITRTFFVYVTGTASSFIPYSESFEDTASFPGVNGIILNEDNGTSWTRTTTAASSGIASIMIDNFTNSAGQIDEWVLPTFDFSSFIQPITMTFDVANAQRTVSSNDKLSFSGSFNCGENWIQRYNKSGSSLATTSSIVATNFIPNATQWRSDTINLNPFDMLPSIRFKFTNTSDNGNNIYIDNINITALIINVDETEDIQLGFSIYPNPTIEASTIQFKLSSKQNVNLQVKNILGQTISNVLNEEMESGLHEVKLPSLQKGIYMIDLYTGNKHHVRRLIVS